MKKILALSLVAAAAFGLAACSEKPAAESAEVNATDTNLTADEAVADINATADNTVDAAGATLDNAANTVDETADNVADGALTNNAM